MKQLILFCSTLFIVIGTSAQVPDTATARQQYNQGLERWRSAPDEAIPLLRASSKTFQHAATAQQTNAHWHSAARALYRAGYAYLVKSNFDSSGLYMDSASALLSATVGIENQTYVEGNYLRMKVHFLEGSYTQGIPHLEHLLEVSLKVNGRLAARTGGIFNALGVFYMETGDLASATMYYEQALGINVEVKGEGHASVGSISTNLGLLYNRQGRHKKALTYLKRAYEIYVQHYEPTSSSVTGALHNLGDCYLKLGQPEEALIHLQKALEGHTAAGLNPAAIALDNDKIGLAYLEIGQHQQAYNALRNGLRISVANVGPEHQDVARGYGHLADWAKAQNDANTALAYADSALAAIAPALDKHTQPDARFDRVQSIPELVALLRQRSELRAWAGKLHAGFDDILLAEQAIDFARKHYHNAESKAELAGQVLPAFETGIELAFQLSQQEKQAYWIDQAFQLMERSKSAILLEGLQQGQAHAFSGVPDEKIEAERQLNLQLSEALEALRTEELKGADADAAHVEELRAAHFDLRQQQEAFLQQLKADYPEYFALQHHIEVATLEQVRGTLLPKTTLLEYFFGDEALYVLAVSNGTEKLHRVELDQQVVSTLRQTIDAHRNRDNALLQGNSAELVAELVASGQYLFELLLAPVLDQAATELIIVPDGLLSFISFETFLAPGTINPNETDFAALPLLIRSHSVRYAYSATVLLREQHATNTPELAFAGFAPSYGSGETAGARDVRQYYRSIRSELPPLAHNATEVEAIANLLGGEAFLHNAATETAFRARANDFGVLHLAMHTFTNDTVPLLSGLVFTEEADSTNDGFLKAWEIYNMQLKANLAVLSACNTGRGKMVRGEGMMSLARAFRYAGCPNLVTSLWQAEDESTAWIMERFYHYLEQGEGKATALRQAKLDYLDSHQQTHPFFWSAFVLVGDGEPLVAAGTPWTRWLGLALGAIALLLWLRFRAQKGRAA